MSVGLRLAGPAGHGGWIELRAEPLHLRRQRTGAEADEWGGVGAECVVDQAPIFSGEASRLLGEDLGAVLAQSAVTQSSQSVRHLGDESLAEPEKDSAAEGGLLARKCHLVGDAPALAAFWEAGCRALLAPDRVERGGGLRLDCAGSRLQLLQSADQVDQFGGVVTAGATTVVSAEAGSQSLRLAGHCGGSGHESIVIEHVFECKR